MSPLVPGNPPEPEARLTALVTVEEARVYLGVGPTESPSDQQLEQMIHGLSARIQQHTGRNYIGDPEDKAAARVFTHYTGDSTADIPECREVTLVEASADPDDPASFTTIDASWYVLEPLGLPIVNRVRFLGSADLPGVGVGWGGLALRTAGAFDPMGTPWPGQVRGELAVYTGLRVTAKWGWGPDTEYVPANVKLALLMWLQNIHKRDQAFFSEATAEPVATQGMPADVEAMLGSEGETNSSVAAI